MFNRAVLDTETTMNEICIVGHGPSLKGSKLGSEIDKYPVVRMKMSRNLQKDNYGDMGKRTDYAGSTTVVIMEVIKQYPQAQEYWAYIKAKHPPSLIGKDERDEMIKEKLNNDWKKYDVLKKLRLFEDVHWKWLPEYYRLRGNDDVRYSTGVGMLIIALEHLKPKKINLAFFDAVMNPENAEWKGMLSNKKYDWSNPPHDFRSENKFIKQVIDHYETEVVDLATGKGPK